MKKLLIDIGNTFAKAAVSDESLMLTPVFRFKKESLSPGIRNLLTSFRPEAAVLSSVSGTDQSLLEMLKAFCGQVTVLNAFSGMPLHIHYSTPETLGADRIAAALGAQALFPEEDCIVFDFGTALTVDFIDRHGNFNGGNISPGMAMRFRAMHHFTEGLPLVDQSFDTGKPGSCTAEAIAGGVVSGMLSEVKGYIRDYPESRIIFTGGDALFFAKKLKITIFVVYNLVLFGLTKVSADHEESE